MPEASGDWSSRTFGKYMKHLLYLIVLCAIGYFVWEFVFRPIPPQQIRVVSRVAPVEPLPLPTDKTVNDSYDSIRVGPVTYFDVTVKKVSPDSISFIHRDGAITLSLADAPKDIQTKYRFNSAQAEEYALLKAAHAQYKKEKANQEEEDQQKPVIVADKSVEPPNPSFLSQIQQAIPVVTSNPTPSPTLSPEPTPPPTPEEQLQALVSGSPVDATKLANLCEMYPSQANLILKGREIKVTGTIKKLWVKGIQSADMDIDLIGTPKRNVVFSTDYARYNTEHTGRQSYDYKLIKSGNILLMYSSHRKLNGGSYETLDHVVHTEGEKVTLEGLIETTGPASIKIHYAKGIK